MLVPGDTVLVALSGGADSMALLNVLYSLKDEYSLTVCAAHFNHGIRGGMGVSQLEEKKAVAAGYWHNFRFNPALAKEGKPAFSLDSKAPTGDFQKFLDGEVRYNALKRANAERAEKLFAISEQDAKAKYAHLQKLVKLYGVEE